LLRTRVLSALVLIPLVALFVYLGGLYFFGAIVLVISVAGYEFVHIMRKGGFEPDLVVIFVALLSQLVIAQFAIDQFLPIVLTCIFIATLTWQMFLGKRKTPTADWALAVAMGLYLGWMGGRFLRIRALPQGIAWIAVALVTTWLSDTGAYFVGTWLGKHKFVPRLSPKKTWEGVVGGWVGAEIGGVALGQLVGLAVWQGLIVGLVVAVLAPLGDLSISMVKRDVGVKDTGKLIPGHGGALDRIDSLLFVVPAVYYLAVWLF
jgi:phosphatidate cytidylyltransferase